MIQPFDTISDLDTATENQVEAHPPRQSTAKRKLKEPSAPPRKKQAALMATNIVPATAGSSITEINLEPYNLLTVTISDGTGPAPLPSPENGTRYRLLPEDDPTTLAWLAFLGNAFTTVGHPPMTLVNFPDGYALYEETKVDASVSI